MPHLQVCSLAHLPEIAQSSAARDLISLLRADVALERPASIAPERHLRLSLNDIAEPKEGLLLAQEEHVAALIGFVRQWSRHTPLLIHCFAGVSRSTAAAYIAACTLVPSRNEAEWAQRLRAASPTATPNPRLIALADRLLAREGRMIAAINAIGRGAECHSGTPFVLELAPP